MSGKDLIEFNRQSFQHLFSKLSQGHQKITIRTFLSFCSKLRIYPDLLSSFQLKRLLLSQKLQSPISYPYFQQLLRQVSQQAFAAGSSYDKIKLLLTHIRNLCLSAYQVPILTVSPIYLPEDNQQNTLNTSRGTKTSRSKMNMNFSPLANFMNRSVSQKFTSNFKPKVTPKLTPNRKTSKNVPRHSSLQAKIANRQFQQSGTLLRSPRVNNPVFGSKKRIYPKALVNLDALETVKIGQAVGKVQKISQKFQNFKRNFQMIQKGLTVSEKVGKLVKVIEKQRIDPALGKFAFEIWRLKSFLSSVKS